MKKGGLFEITLRVVQESLRDKDDTEVIPNYKLKNPAGRTREFDVAIKSTINGFNFLAVIECKDYSGAVPVEKIEAFEGKCSRIPDINKKIFVSRNGYQEDAINAAKDFGIEIYDVHNIDPETIAHWLPVSCIKPIIRSIRVTNIRCWTKPPINKPEFDISSTLFHDTEPPVKILDFSYRLLHQQPAISNPVFYFSREDKVIDRTESMALEVSDMDGYYLVNGEGDRHNFVAMTIFFDLQEKQTDSELTVERIKSGAREMATVITHDSPTNETIKLVLKDGEENSFDPFIVDKNTGKVFDPGCTFKFVKIKE